MANAVSSHMHNLPPQLTSFVGREQEIAEVTALLTDPACRLLTLVGPGGIGKTRLAIQVAAQLTDHFPSGIVFVPLQSVGEREQLLSTLADALPIALSGHGESEPQVLEYLREQNLLLVMDSVEALLAEAPFFSTLLQECAAIKLLVTSQEVLNLQEEWLYPVRGLAVPETDEGDDLERYDAVRLFTERACRVRAHFSLAAEGETVARICRLVEGMPLAIELAASWIRNMSCEAIAAEIERNVGFLSTRLRNVPERHRSLQAVFDQTWRLLTPAEQETFRALSVFAGGFRWEAAQAVADASLPILTGLVDKSLLRVDAQGRYQLHGLLRQYARERLDAEAGQEASVRDRHCTYYLDFLHRRQDAIVGARQQEAVGEIAAELENIRTAWQWAIERERLDDLRRVCATLQTFFDFQSRFREEMDLFERAVQSLDAVPPSDERQRTLAALLPFFGWSAIRLGRLDDARRAFTRSLDFYRSRNVEVPPVWGMDPLPGLGLVATTMGDYAAAIEMACEAERLCLARNDEQNLQIVYYVWENAAYAQGDYETARQYAQRAYTLTEAMGNRWMMAYVLSDLGNIARALGEYAQARRYYVASYEIKEAFSDPEGKAAALIQLAHTAQLQENYAEAADLYRQGEAIYRQIHDQGGLASALHGLGEAAFYSGDPARAVEYLRQALQLAAGINWTPKVLSILVSIADLLWTQRQSQRSVALLGLVMHHAAAEHQTRRRAVELLSAIDAHQPASWIAAAMERGQGADLDTVVADLPLFLSTAHVDGADQPPVPSIPKDEQPLVEPLTDRERDVLHLMAEGLTNREIADQLIVAIGTVKSYTSQIYGKLGVRNRTEATRRAQALGLLQSDPIGR